MDTLKFQIATPEGVVYQDSIYKVSIPTTSGEITVLPDHIPLVSVLQAGELKITDKDGEHPYAVSGGFLEIKNNNEIIILADNVERANDIDLEASEKARQRAEEEMEKTKSEDNIDFAKLQAVIDREMNKIRVGNKYKQTRNT